MTNCIYCEAELSDRGLFCKSCGKQTTCANCKEILEIDARFCTICGNEVGKNIVGNGVNKATETRNFANTFEFQETRSGRSAKATLTDQSVASLQETLSLIVSAYPLGTPVRRNNRKPDELSGNLFPDNFDMDADDIIDVTPRTLSSVATKTAQQLKRLFYMDGDKLVLEVQDLKASGQKDFGIRLIYLRMLYAKEVEKQEFVQRDDLNATLKEVMGTLDPHVVNWISTTNDLSIKEDNNKALVRLKADGYTKALAALADIENPELKGEYTLEKKLSTSSKSTKAKSDETKGSKSTKSAKPKLVDEWISKWTALDLKVDVHGIAKDLNQLDRVVLALWLIHQATNSKVDTATTTRIAPIISQLFFVQISRQGLDRALKSGYPEKLQKTPNGWRITPDGLKLAQGFVDNFSKSAASTKSGGKK